ncbi:MAG: hypothetical protein IPO91_10220 [Chloroflexi bacterium]|nr:hypothetical protein [Chloroflexota bacterium]
MRRSLCIFTLLSAVLLVSVIAPVQGQISTTAFTVDATTNPVTATQPDGSSADIATDETVTLRIQFVLPESTTISIRTDTVLGASFTYVNNSARVSYLAGTLPSFNGDFAGIQNETEPSFTFPASRVTVIGSTLSFDFGSAINNDGDGDAENLIIEYDLIPAVGAVSGTAVNLTYDLVIDEGLPTEEVTTSSQVTLNLVDPPGVTVTQSGGGTAVTEGGATDTFTFVLTSQPSADVTITVTPDAQVSVDKPTLTFTSTDWNTAQTVTVTAVDDNVAEGSPHSGAITFAAAGGGYTGLSITPVSVSITDNDNSGVTITESSGSTAVTEGDATDTFTVVLTSQPSADVTITVTPDAQVSVDQPTLTFTTLNWNSAQTVTVTAVDDSVAEGTPHSGAVTFAAAGGGYTGLSITAVSVSITDNDNGGLSLAPLAFQLTEGVTNSYTIRLLSTPTVAPITLLVEFPTDQVSVNGNNTPFTLTFSDTTPQTITFTVLANADNNTPRAITIRHTITSSSAAEYPPGTQAVVTLAIDDVPPPPPSPTCDSENFSVDGVVRTGVPDGLANAINCRVLYHNGSATTWLGSPLYSAAHLGVPGLLDLGVLQAVDIFSPPPSNLTYFQNGIVMCLRGEGTLIWLAASHAPRTAEIIGSYTVPEFPNFTCASLFEPGTLILVSVDPLTR